MTKKQNRKILVYVKEHSPKEYAETIRKRCSIALVALDGLDNRVIPIGCPHCAICRLCIWDEAFRNVLKNYCIMEPCTTVEFNGVDWKGAQPAIRLTPTGVSVVPALDGPYARKFLQGHIDWANERGWGKKHKET